MKILGIDYGKKKMGVAVAESDEKLVQPIGIVANDQFEPLSVAKSSSRLFSMINPSTGSGQVLQRIINDQNVKKIVVGVPGGEIDCEVREFGKRIEKETGIPVEFFDETLTTQDAQRVLIESGSGRKKRKEKEDAIAAALMLQYYLEGGGKNV